MYKTEYQHGGEIYNKAILYDFSVNTNPFELPETVRDQYYYAAGYLYQYPDNQCNHLRKAIAEKEKIEKEDIFCGNGASDVIYRLCAVLKPKKALLLAPTFSEYENALRLVGSEIVYYPLRAEKQFCVGEDIEAFLKQDIDFVFLCNPNNPTGSIIPMGIMDKILDFSRINQIPLAIDECFIEFIRDYEAISAVTYISANPYLFIIKAFTKTYAIAGLRLGYGICKNKEWIERMKKAGPPWSVSIPAQMCGIEACHQTDYLRETALYLEKEREFMTEKLGAFGFYVYPSKTNYLLFRAYPSLYQELLQNHILIRQCGNYIGLGTEYYRICMKKHRDNLKLLEQLEKCLEERHG